MYQFLFCLLCRAAYISAPKYSTNITIVDLLEHISSSRAALHIMCASETRNAQSQCTYVSVWFESTAAGSNSEYSQLFCIPTVRSECLACTDTFLNQNELRVYCVYCIWHSAAPSSVRTGFHVKESSITCLPVNACSPFQRSNRVCRIWSIERTSD